MLVVENMRLLKSNRTTIFFETQVLKAVGLRAYKGFKGFTSWSPILGTAIRCFLNYWSFREALE